VMDDNDDQEGGASYRVGYGRPPRHTRFKPGQSGNPSGRRRGSRNVATLLKRILNEEVSLREGANVRQVSKREAILRGMVVGALRGDTRSMGTLFRLAEQTGELEQPPEPMPRVTRIIITAAEGPDDGQVPGITEINSDDP